MFYYLLLCEIFRETDQVDFYRKQAIDIDSKNNIGLYKMYLKVVDYTQEKIKVDFFSGRNFSEPNIVNKLGITKGLDVWSDSVSWDNAMVALDLVAGEISDKDYKFLRKTSLKIIMEAHQIW